jgi:quercetin dioxygenase-like cupin family protein
MAVWQPLQVSAFCLLLTTIGMAACTTSGSTAAPNASAGTPQEPQIAWRANPQLPGVSNASGVGNPAQSGLYAVFGRMEKGVRFPPHRHPDERLTTVMHGTMYLGIGTVFEEDKVKAYPVGSVVMTPANTLHYMWAKDGVVIMQEAGSGPSGMVFSQ